MTFGIELAIYMPISLLWQNAVIHGIVEKSEPQFDKFSLSVRIFASFVHNRSLPPITGTAGLPPAMSAKRERI
jgi:hypothetical protein